MYVGEGTSERWRLRKMLHLLLTSRVEDHAIVGNEVAYLGNLGVGKLMLISCFCFDRTLI